MRKNSLVRRFAAFSMMVAMIVSMFPVGTYSAANVYAAENGKSKVEELERIFTTEELMDASIEDLETAMESGELTAKQLVEMYIERIETYDKSLDLNSIIVINPKAIEEAEKLDEMRAKGEIKGALHGIPVIVKDNYDVEGMPTTAGCLALSDSIAPDDSYAVKKLKEAGAIIIAKANMSEFASSGSNSRSTKGGVVHNSYDPLRTAAGSSGGTAVSVTANFGTVGLGTDTGSSIRRPSSFSNLYGLRPSKGLTSIDGVVPLNEDRDVTGPLCRSVEDLATVMSIIAGTDEADHYTVDADSLKPEEGYESHLLTDGLAGKKIGYLSNSFGYYVTNTGADAGEKTVELDAKIADIVDGAKARLAAGGAELVDISSLLPETLITELRQGTSYTVFEWDVNKYFATLGENAPIKTAFQLINNYTYGVDYTNFSVKNPTENFSDMIDPRTTQGWESCWSNMVNFRTVVSNILEENGIDAVIFVSQTDVADIETTSNNKNNAASYLNYFGPVAGLPEMMIPMGFAYSDPDNGFDTEMPLGMSMFTSYGNEETLMEIAYSYEQVSGPSIRRMPSTVPALPDENVNEFLADLMEDVDAIDFDNYTIYPTGLVNVLLKKYELASEVDTSDVYTTYDAAYELAVAYDKVMAKLSGKEVPTVEPITKAPEATTVAPTTKAPEATTVAPTTKAPEATTVAPTTKAPETTKVAPANSVAAKASISKLVKAKKKIKISIKKERGVIGYQIKYSTSKKFKADQTSQILSKSANATIKGIKTKKTYYVKVRALMVVDGKLVYGKWSAKKKV
ncbi:MAG: hypothetical protein K6G88_10710 [Lachnospiraceae bacterium]|nr:hypothetical protein [Lachnospiraceae bacterium]